MNVQQREERPDSQAILAKLKRLTPQQKAEVLHFIDFVNTKPSGSSMAQQLQAAPAPSADFQEVRRRLAKIKGSMAETVRTLRDERG